MAMHPRALLALLLLACSPTATGEVGGEASGPAAGQESPQEGGAPAPGAMAPDGGSPAGGAPCVPIGETPHVRLCKVERVGQGVLVGPATSAALGKNFQGPTVIRAPAFIPNKLGAYTMYFAAHDGHSIRLAYADTLAGPWTLHAGGTLKDTEVAPFTDTIASPDLHVVPGEDTLRMYFHTDKYPGSTQQWSGVAESADGLKFTLASTTNIAKYYLRAFPYAGKWYGLQKGWDVANAELGVSPDGVAPFGFVKTMGQGSVRHMGVLVKGDVLLVFFSRIGDTPERIYLSTIDLRTSPDSWDFSAPVEVLRPELPYEGAQQPAIASVKGPATNVNQLRDPFVFEEGGVTTLFYTVAGESGIAAATIDYQLR